MSESLRLSAEVRAMIERLIAFDTTSRNSNLELIHYVRDYLKDLGVASHLTYDDARSKANLYATLGPTDRGGIALSGHTDVVPVDGQDWSSDPWTVEERDGRLYGRGTCDMKGFIAVVLAYAPRFLERGLETPIHLCLSYDEEVGCKGAPRMLAFLAEQAVKPRACIVGEPTDMKVIVGHKGKLSYLGRVRGLECHSALAPKGVNAIQEAARAIAKIAEMAARKAESGPFDEDYDIAHSTIHCGLVQGGTALNIVPAECSFEFEFRCLPNDDPGTLLAELQAYVREQVEPAMKAIAPGTGFTWEELSFFPGLELSPDAEVVAMVKALTGANTTGKVAFGTEAGLFQGSGIPAVICGPGSIEQAHKPDEYVSLEQLALCERFMTRLMDRASAA
ncbi:MAG: acetylornithine deacetylase [Kiloniellales bacterium]